MRKIIICCLLLCFLCGCSSNKDDLAMESALEKSYNDGYNDAYEDYVNQPKTELFKDEYIEFKRLVVNLMYDCEYDAVKKMRSYYSKAVDEALENEFGTKNITDIAEYLESHCKEQEETVVGICKFCKKTVYANDATRYSSCNTLHESTDDCPICTYVHSGCLFENDPQKIEKNP